MLGSVKNQECIAKCPCCKACNECVGFQKILNLKNTGLIIYRHRNCTDEVDKSTGVIESSLNTTDDIFIIHNTKDTQLTADDCITDIDREISCPRCRKLVERAKKYIRYIPTIGKKDIISVCEHCQRKKTKKQSFNKCCNCQEVVKKFHAERNKQSIANEKIKTWLSRVHKLLENVTSDRRPRDPLKFRAYSELYLNSLCKPAFNAAHRLEVGPLLEKGGRMSESFRSIVHDTSKSESDLLLLDYGTKKIKSVLIKTESIIHPLSQTSSVATYNTTLDREDGKNKNELESDQALQWDLKNKIHQKEKEFTQKTIIKPDKARGTLEKHYSESYLFGSMDGLKRLGVDKNFSYIFPKKASDEIIPLRRAKTSAELIVDTQEMLRFRALLEKIKQQAQINILKPRKTQKQEEAIKSDEDKKIHLKNKSIKGTENIPESEKLDRPSYKEKKSDTDGRKSGKQKIQRDNIHSQEKETQLHTKKKSDQLGKPKEEKQRIMEKKENKKKSLIQIENATKFENPLNKNDTKESKSGKEKIQKEKKNQEKENTLYTKEKPDKLGKGKEEKQKIAVEKPSGKKEEHQKVQAEKIKYEDENDKKTEKIPKPEDNPYAASLKKMIDEQAKIDLSHPRKPQVEENKSIKMETHKKTKEEAESKLKTLKVNKIIDPEVLKSANIEEEPTSKEQQIKQIKMRKSSTDDLILQLIKLQQSSKKTERGKPQLLSDINYSPKIHNIRKLLNHAMSADSDLELDVENILNTQSKTEITDLIVGNKIVKSKLPLNEKAQTEEIIPILYKSLFSEDMAPTRQQDLAENLTNQKDKPYPLPLHKYAEQELPKGVTRYALSDRSFIDKGWTMLPTEKVVRKMNVYRMRPAHPEFDWFDRNKDKKLMLYDTGEKLAEFDDNGRGRLFYRNGRLALDYYDAEEINAQQRFVVYGSGEPDERGRYQPIAILGTFDYLGNGVVFDHAGKIRLKYNQTEGVVLDREIGPVSHWKWHTLNDPPVLQQVMIDTQMAHKDPDILKLGGPADDKVRPDNEEMLAIEFDNFIREKSKKLSQKFKPFQIRTKALKINGHLSLKVLDQANIYLIFRDGSTNIKLNIGMILNHQEIVDTDTAEVGEVSNNLDRFPARTDSLAGLQRSVAYAQRVERCRVERERRLRHPEPCSSADRLVSAASRPLRPQIQTPSISTDARDECYCKCRKPSTHNIYYDTRLV